MLRAAGCGFGYLGLADMLAHAATTGDQPLAVRQPNFPPRAKRVIFLFMHGGPSSVDTFDPKPRLTLDDGKPLPIKRPLAFAGGRKRDSWAVWATCIRSRSYALARSLEWLNSIARRIDPRRAELGDKRTTRCS